MRPDRAQGIAPTLLRHSDAPNLRKIGDQGARDEWRVIGAAVVGDRDQEPVREGLPQVGHQAPDGRREVGLLVEHRNDHLDHWTGSSDLKGAAGSGNGRDSADFECHDRPNALRGAGGRFQGMPTKRSARCLATGD
jgi:hypothetical protein